MKELCLSYVFYICLTCPLFLFFPPSSPFFPISGPLFTDSQRASSAADSAPELASPKKKVTWASALKGQPHAPLQIFHLIKYTSIVSHTCEAALT